MKRKNVDYIIENKRIRRRELGLKPLFSFIMSALFMILILSTVSYISESSNGSAGQIPTNTTVINGIVTEVVDFKAVEEVSEGTKTEEKTDDAKEPEEEVTGDKIVYLTFDDGPSEYTSKLLDTLKKYNVKATFFVTCKGSDDLISRENREGHVVGLHTCSHVYDIYRSLDTYFNDLNQVASRVSRIIGTDAKLIRFPGGSSNTVSARYNKGIMTALASEVERRGYTYFDWNVASRDTESNNNADTVFNNVINGINARGSNSFSVVLQHDIKSYSVDAVERIIEYGKKNGYVFKTLSPSSPVTHHGINN